MLTVLTLGCEDEANGRARADPIRCVKQAGNSAGCRECARLHQAYEQATAALLQAEAYFLMAMNSADPLATEHATATLDSAVARWIQSDRALRAHQHDGYVRGVA